MSAAALRTPDERFADLPGFDFEPQYAEVSGLRLAWIEAGEGPPVVLLHGEPTWSFLWRDVIPPIAAAGFRCIAPDLAGFGRSDKPTAREDYSYDRHTALMQGLLFDHLDLQDVTWVVHDWGGCIGLRLAVENADRTARLVAMDTGLFTGYQQMPDAWHAFRDFVERTEDIPIGFLVNGAVARDLSPEEIAAYEAPFPAPEYKMGARAFPLMLPLAPDAPGAEAGQRTLEGLKTLDRPTLLLWADGDPVIPHKVGVRFAETIGAPEPEVIPQASHFLQEDQGTLIGERIAAWLTD
jgi:haloalkane dehalogenase